MKHVYTKDPTTGQWTRMTDPDAIAALLNRPDGGVQDAWTIYTTEPDVDLLRTVLAFQFGRSFTPADVPDLGQVLLEHFQTGKCVTLRERLQRLPRRASARHSAGRSARG